MTDPIVIIVDGLDGSGKSSLIPGLVEWLAEKRRRPVQSFRDPGSTPLGEKIRSLVKNAAEPMEQTTQFLLFCAARAELATLVNRHLAKGEDVVLDRWWYSTYAYQGALSIDKKLIRQIAQETADLAQYPHSFYLDVSEEVARKRISLDAEVRKSSVIKDRFESMDLGFRLRVRENYKELWGGGEAPLDRVDTDPLTPHEVFIEVTRILARRLDIR